MGAGKWRSRSGFARSALLFVTLLGCRCSRLSGEIDGQRFTRCGQVDAPRERTFRAGALALRVRERVLEITATGPLPIVAFAGPVGAAFAAEDLALLKQANAGLALYLGGLGDTEAIAKHNLSALAALRLPTLFVAGGSDRFAVIEAAFSALPDSARDFVVQGSGLRELRIGSDRFVIVAGAAWGRYTIDEQGCGFTAADLEDIQQAASTSTAPRTWLLSWQAPSGFGVSEGLAGTELGSADLRKLATTVGAKGGLFAFPAAQAARPRRAAPLALVVPRLARVGTLRGDGSRLPAALAQLTLGPEGLGLAPFVDGPEGPGVAP